MFKKETPVLDQALNYMNEKYGEEFTFVSVTGATMGGNTSKMIVSCESLQDAEIIVSCTKNDDGSYTFRDNYMAHYYKSDLISAVESVVNEVYGKGKIFYTVSNDVLPDQYDINTQFETYTSEQESMIDLIIVLDESSKIETKDVDLEEFRRLLYKRGLIISGRLYYSINGEYESIDETYINAGGGRGRWNSLTVNFVMDRNGDFISVNWR